MKKVFLLSLVMVMAFQGQVLSQVLSASELIDKSNCTTFECINEYFIKKGYSYNFSDKTDKNETYYYKYDGANGDAYEFSVGLSNERNQQHHLLPLTLICFETTSKSAYIKSLGDFKNNGFIVKETTQKKDVFGDGVTTEYISTKNKNLSLKVSVYKKVNDAKNRYSFTIFMHHK